MYETPLLREWRLAFAGHWPPSELKSGDSFHRFGCRLPGWLFPFSEGHSQTIALGRLLCRVPGTDQARSMLT